MIDSLLAADTDASHFCNAVDMAQMIPRISENIITLGNISSAEQFRSGTPDSVRKMAFDLLSMCAEYPNFIIFSWRGIPPSAPWENINAFFAAVKESHSKS